MVYCVYCYFTGDLVSVCLAMCWFTVNVVCVDYNDSFLMLYLLSCFWWFQMDIAVEILFSLLLVWHVLLFHRRSILNVVGEIVIVSAHGLHMSPCSLGGLVLLDIPGEIVYICWWLCVNGNSDLHCSQDGLCSTGFPGEMIFVGCILLCTN